MASAPLNDARAFMEWLVKRAGTQAELARKAELLPETISDYVRGVNEPKLTNVLKMLRGADVVIEGMPERPDRDEEIVRILRLVETRLGQRDPSPAGDEES